MYLSDYDGVVAAAPAIQWNHVNSAHEWLYIDMNNKGYASAQYDFCAVLTAVVRACDGLDGLDDGIISAPGPCDFDPYSLVGHNFICDTDTSTRAFHNATITIVQAICQGPMISAGARLWYARLPGANFSSLVLTWTKGNGTTS